MRVAGIVLIASLVLGSAARAAPLDLEAELQVGERPIVRAVQAGILIYSSGAAGEFDNSAPPVKWPSAIAVEPGEPLAVLANGIARPASVELRFWSKLRKNGIPKRPVGQSECFPGPVLVDCELSPAISQDGDPGWAVTLETPTSKGHLYIAANFTWDDSTTSQAVWIFHARLKAN